jgi:hypothetical protein
MSRTLTQTCAAAPSRLLTCEQATLPRRRTRPAAPVLTLDTRGPSCVPFPSEGADDPPCALAPVHRTRLPSPRHTLVPKRSARTPSSCPPKPKRRRRTEEETRWLATVHASVAAHAHAAADAELAARLGARLARRRHPPPPALVFERAVERPAVVETVPVPALVAQLILRHREQAGARRRRPRAREPLPVSPLRATACGPA